MEELPEFIKSLAEKAKGKPIAWRVYPGYISIVFEDGRKMQFIPEDQPAPASHAPKPTSKKGKTKP